MELISKLSNNEKLMLNSKGVILRKSRVFIIPRALSPIALTDMESRSPQKEGLRPLF